MVFPMTFSASLALGEAAVTALAIAVMDLLPLWGVEEEDCHEAAEGVVLPHVP